MSTPLPPMKAKSETSTLSPSGTWMSAPPISEKTVSSVRCGGELGVVEVEVAAAHDVERGERARRSRQRPLRSQPPMIAMSQRAPPSPRADRQPGGAALGRRRLLAGHDDVGHEPLQLGAGARPRRRPGAGRRARPSSAGRRRRRGAACPRSARGRRRRRAAQGAGRRSCSFPRVTGTSAPSANGGTSSIRSPLQKRPGSYQLAGRRPGSRPMCCTWPRRARRSRSSRARRSGGRGRSTHWRARPTVVGNAPPVEPVDHLHQPVLVAALDRPVSGRTHARWP